MTHIGLEGEYKKIKEFTNKNAVVISQRNEVLLKTALKEIEQRRKERWTKHYSKKTVELSL